MSAKEMTCMSCGSKKAYPDAFPNRAYAECWQCAWDAHIRREHPEVARRIRREAKRRARRLKRAEIEAAMFEHERQQVITPTAANMIEEEA